MATTQPEAIGFPPGVDYRGLEDFKGINTKAKRPAIDDEECSWLENIMPIGKGNARAMYGRGNFVFIAPLGLTIVYCKAFVIGSVDYDFVALSDGSAVQVQINGVQTPIGTPGLFYNGGDLPHVTQYGASGILIISDAQPDGYFAWDGTLWIPGGASPPWLSGLPAPIVVTGTTNGTNVISGIASTVGIVVGMLASAPDIPPNSFVSGGTSSTITISNAATGSNTEEVTFTWPMPTGIKGTGIDTYQGRVWIVAGPQRLMSAAGNGTYFAAANGGDITVSSDSNLLKAYTALVAANGYIYFFGDSAIYNGSNVSQTVTNGVATATYQYTNSDPQTGTLWPNSAQVFGRAIIFVNANGVYDLLGNSATKISDQLDGIFANLDQSVVPTCAVGTIYGIRVLAVCIRATDYLKVVRNILCLFDGKRWWVASQETPPTFIWTREIGSELTIMATDGTETYPLFQTPSMTLLKTMQSKLYGGQYGYLTQKQSLRYYLQLDPLGFDDLIPQVTIDSETSSIPVQGSLGGQLIFLNQFGDVIQFQNATADNIFWTLNGLINCVNAVNSGFLLGFTLTDLSGDFVIERTGVSYRDEMALY